MSEEPTTGAVEALPGDCRPNAASACQKDGFVMTGTNLTYEKIAETVEFPRFFGRADRI